MARKSRAHHICPICQQEDKDNQYKDNFVILKCEYCGKEFRRAKSKLEKSKSGLYFCCREHKDMAQRLGSGNKFDTMRPDHYGQGGIAGRDYRSMAFAAYDHKCAICGYDGDGDIGCLDVHHIDSNRENNILENLIIVCPNCHRKLTQNKYKISEDKKSLIKIV